MTYRMANRMRSAGHGHTMVLHYGAVPSSQNLSRGTRPCILNGPDRERVRKAIRQADGSLVDAAILLGVHVEMLRSYCRKVHLTWHKGRHSKLRKDAADDLQA